MTVNAPTRSASSPEADVVSPLSVRRVKAMRAGYGFVGVGLVVAKWPSLLHAHSAEQMEAVSLSMLTAMSVLMLLGLRYPLQMLPILLFEAGWKLTWFAAVWLPGALAGDLDPLTRELAVKNALVVVVLLVIPWRYVWNHRLTR